MGPQNTPRFLGLPGSDLAHLPVSWESFKPGTNLIFLRGLCKSSVIQLRSLKLIYASMLFSNMTFPSKPGLYNQCFKLCPVTKRTNSLLIYANSCIAIKIKVLNKSFQILED